MFVTLSSTLSPKLFLATKNSFNEVAQFRDCMNNSGYREIVMLCIEMIVKIL